MYGWDVVTNALVAYFVHRMVPCALVRVRCPYSHGAYIINCREFEAVDVRTLRASVGTLCDLLALCVRTAEAFPPLKA